MDIAGINANKPYPINDALYKRIKEEGIQLKYKETGKKADYSLTDNTGNTPCIHIPANCLQIQGWLEIQWDESIVASCRNAKGVMEYWYWFLADVMRIYI